MVFYIKSTDFNINILHKFWKQMFKNIKTVKKSQHT